MIGAGIGIVQLWALSHILDPHEYGVIGAAAVLIQFLTIFMDFGITNAIIRRTEITEIELSSLYLINVCLGAAIFAFAFFSSHFFASFFRSSELSLQIKVMSLAFLISPFGQQQKAILARDMRFNLIAMVSIVNFVLNFAVVVTLALIFHRAWVASVAFLFSTCASSLIFFIQGLRERRLSFKFRWSAARPHIRYSVQLVGDSLINAVSINTYPTLMARLVSLSAIGGYNIANNISISLIERLKPVLTQALFPAFARIQNDETKLATNFLLVTTYGSLVNFPLLAGMLVVSETLVSVFFNAQWHFIVNLVRVLCLVGMVRSIDAPVISLLLVRAKMYLNVRIGIFKLFAGIALAYLMGRQWGITGIVCSFLIIQTANTVLGYFFLVKSCIRGIGRQYAESILIPLLQIVPLVLAASAVVYFPPMSSAGLTLALAIAAGTVAYLAGLALSPFKVVRGFVQMVVANVSPKLLRHV